MLGRSRDAVNCSVVPGGDLKLRITQQPPITLFQTIDDNLLVAHNLDAIAYGQTAEDAGRPARCPSSYPSCRPPTSRRGLCCPSLKMQT